ncbi:MAG: hypothetical protein MZW92_27325 [Comamonadaceae bacterium]|nr:hypothetical protein [Comamonadaceae bacterium]
MIASLPRPALKVLLLLLVLAIAAPVLWTWAALSYNYSDGERAGFVQKLSRKGWICKTWEGELALVNLPGAMPEIFYFSVRDDAVAQRIQKWSASAWRSPTKNISACRPAVSAGNRLLRRQRARGGIGPPTGHSASDPRPATRDLAETAGGVAFTRWRRRRAAVSVRRRAARHRPAGGNRAGPRSLSDGAGDAIFGRGRLG